MTPRNLILALGAASLVAACGTESATSTGAEAGTGHLSVVHVTPSTDATSAGERVDVGGFFTEGARVFVLVSDESGEVLHRQLVVHPGFPPEGPERYDLLRDIELPAGRLTVRAELRVCSGSCADIATLSADLREDELPTLTSRSDVCEVEIDLMPGEDREAELVNNGALWECEIADARPGEGPPEWGLVTMVHDSRGQAPTEAAAIMVGSRDKDDLPFKGGSALYPGSPFDPEGAPRYDLMRDVRFPPGRWEFYVSLSTCGGCPHPDTFDGSLYLFLFNNDAEMQGYCQFTIDIAPGEHLEIELLNENGSHLPTCPPGQ